METEGLLEFCEASTLSCLHPLFALTVRNIVLDQCVEISASNEQREMGMVVSVLRLRSLIYIFLLHCVQRHSFLWGITLKEWCYTNGGD